MPLYGNELGLDTTPFEAGLGPVVSFTKAEVFVGRAALEAAKEAGPPRVLVGLRGLGRRAGRGGYRVLAPAAPAERAVPAAPAERGEIEATGEGRGIGVITSGQPSPSLGYPVALALVDPAFAEPGTAVDVELRGKREPFEVVSLPFYQRQQ